MALKITPKQVRKAASLARSHCCNCIEGCCLLLGGETCVQVLAKYGIYCTYFRDAVLPGDKKLYQEIMNKNKEEKK